MKLFNNKLAITLFSMSTIPTVFVGCKDNQAEKWVDLRYRVDDSYLVKAANPEPITFQVKSTETWTVSGKYDWYTISPATGNPGETYDVTIQCQENTNLDDRIDTINIKSDYWTGKTFTLLQKGIAYLEYENPDIINQSGGSSTFQVAANQKWTAKVTEGDNWLSITNGTEGENDGVVTVTAVSNSGEVRVGKVTIYDRHSKETHVVECKQNGVQLNPDIPDNGEWFQLYEEAQTLKIHVESNAEWTVTKKDEADEEWYDFDNTSFTGTGDIVINLTKNTGANVRTGNIILSTKAEEGVTQLVKNIKFKQANPRTPEVIAENMTAYSGSTYYGPSELMPGIYNFYVKPLDGADMNLFFLWSGSNPYAELRYHVISNKTKLSTTPWCGNVYDDITSIDVDPNTENILSWDIQKYVDENDPTKVWIYTEWLLNNTCIAKCISDGFIDGTQYSDTWKVPFDQINTGGHFLFKAINKDVTISKCEYIAPINWGN